METKHQIEHDHEAIRAMLAMWAADDTSWDQPPMLFALVYDRAAGYGVVPARPLNAILHEWITDYPFHAALKQIVANLFTIEQTIPGFDTLRIAVRVCREEPPVARQWFPKVSDHTVACGLVLRTEAWQHEREEGAPFPEGSFADELGAVESLTWQAVVDDDTFDLVWWNRGEAAPQFHHWSFDSDLYRSAKDRQRVPTLMRKIVRLSARASLTPEPHYRDAYLKLESQFPGTLSNPGPFGRF